MLYSRPVCELFSWDVAGRADASDYKVLGGVLLGVL